MEKTKNLLTTMQNNPNVMFHVKDVLSKSYIERKIDLDFLNKNFNGDISQFIKKFEDKGYKGIILVPKIKNGSGERRSDIVPIEIAFKAQNITPATASQPALPNTTGLNGLDLVYTDLKHRHGELTAEHKELKREYEKLKDEHIALKTDSKISEFESKRLKKKVSKLKENKPSAIVETVQGLGATNEGKMMMMGLAETLLTKLFPQNGAQPTRQNQESPAQPSENNFTPWQQVIVDSMYGCPDNVCEDISKLLERHNLKDTAFLKEFSELVSRPSLQKVSSDG